MIYAQFFQPSAIDKSRLIEACGDRAVVIYDARRRLADTLADARAECAKRGFSAFQLCRGETFTRSRAISQLFTVTQ